MPIIKTYDIHNENFNSYFKDMVAGMTFAQKSLLPDNLKHKLIRGGKDKVSAMFTFSEKVYVLQTCFDVQIVINMYPKGQELDKKDLIAINNARDGKETNSELLKRPHVKAGFSVADKNLFESLYYLNRVYTSEIYTLFKRIDITKRSIKDRQFVQGRDVVAGVTDLILKYEQYKKSIVMENGLDPQKLYALMYFSTGEKLGKDFCQRDFAFAYNQSGRMLSGAIKWLTDMGYLNRRGGSTLYRYTLTSKGVNLLTRIMTKIVDNYLQQQ